MSNLLRKVLGTTYDYYFPQEKALQEAIEAEPVTLRSPPSDPCKDRAIKVAVVKAPCLDCGGQGPHNPAPGCHPFR